LPGNDNLLNVRQQPLPFGQRQTKIGDLAEIIRSADLYRVEASGLTNNAG
jgi:hypothetical protein